MSKRTAARLTSNPDHVAALKALAHAGRLDVFSTLARARREMSAGEVQSLLGIPGPTLSHHLDQLRRAGLVRSRRQERFIYYAVDAPGVGHLVRLLATMC